MVCLLSAYTAYLIKEVRIVTRTGLKVTAILSCFCCGEIFVLDDGISRKRKINKNKKNRS
jgi:hypothetical protein